MAIESAAGEQLLLVARVLFGGLLTFVGSTHFTAVEMKGLPAGQFSVVASGVVLVLVALCRRGRTLVSD